MPIKLKFTFLYLTCLLSLVSGCVDTPMLYHGNTVTSAPVVALQEGHPTAGRWETFDLVIEYRSIKNGDILEISGEASLSRHYQMTYDGLRRMYVYIFFLDKDSRVLKTAYLINAWFGNTQDIREFSESYKVPIETAGISFGYSGEVGEDKGNKTFYKLPLN